MTTRVSPVTLSGLQSFIVSYAPDRRQRDALLHSLNTFALELAKQVFTVHEGTAVVTLFSDPRMPSGRCYNDKQAEGEFSFVFKFYSPITPNVVIGQVNMTVRNGVSENNFAQYILRDSTNFTWGDDCESGPVDMEDLTNPVSRRMAERLDGEKEVVYSPKEAREKLQWLRVRNDLSGRTRVGKDIFDAFEEYEDSNRYIGRSNVVKVRYKGDSPQRANTVTIELSDDDVIFATTTIVYSK